MLIFEDDGTTFEEVLALFSREEVVMLFNKDVESK